jgi:Phage integrase family
MPDLANLLRHDGCPRRERKMRRPLIADQVLQQELARRNDLARMYSCYSATPVCASASASIYLAIACMLALLGEWAIHIPLFRWIHWSANWCSASDFSLARSDAVPMASFWHGRADGKCCHQISEAAGIPARIVPHRLRHIYATFMLRAGVSFPGILKLLGHSSPDMTMRYLGIRLPDLKREY